MAPEQLMCPKCNHIDQIQKVSSVFSSGVSTGIYSGPSVAVGTPIGKGQVSVSGGYTTLSGGSQSLLSERLVPPGKPSLEGVSQWGISMAIAIGLFICGCFGMTGLSENNPSFVILALVFIIVGFGGGVVIGVGANHGKKKREAELAAKIPHWEQAVARWNRLYYCARDDGVFDPDEGVFVPIEEMMDYLYR